MRSTIILIALSSPLLAQFGEFTTTDDGRQLYFTTILQLAGAPTSNPETRIFRIDDSGIALFVERGALAATGTFASGFGARNPQVSADGSTLGFLLRGVCPTPDPCTSGVSQAILRKQNGANIVLGSDAFALSHDAHWAVLTTTAGPPPINGPPHSTLINVATGERTPLPGPVNALFPIASDGTVVLFGGLWRQGTVTPLPLTGPFSVFAISDHAQVLVYGQLFDFPANPTQRLIVRDLASGNETIVFSRPAAAGPVAAMGLTTDGQRLLYLVADKSNAGTAFLANTVSGESAALPLPNGEAVVSGILSGSGNMAFLVTTSGRVASVDLTNGGAVRTLIPPTPYIPDFPVLTPGSFVRLSGNLPRSLSALNGHLFVNDVPMPVLDVSNPQIGAQLPWEATIGQSAFRLDVATDSPFRQNQWIDVRPMFPRFIPLGPGQTSILGFIAIRSDFSGLLTTQPHPGDVIVVYATGLGAVNGPVVTGKSAPFDHTLAITGQFRCHFNPYGADADTLFAGLAPGLIGFYQINFRLPSEPDPGPITGGVCFYSGPGVDGGFSWTLVAGAT